MKIKLDPHQERFLEWSESRCYLPILADQGTGKTIMALAWLESLHLVAKAMGRPDPFLILCETKSIGTWVKECNTKSHLKAVGLTGSITARNNVLDASYDVLIAGYDCLDTPFGPRLGDQPWKAIVADESTHLKNYKAKRTKLACRLFKHVPYRAIMTGTPVTNKHAVDLWAQFLFLDHGTTFYPSFWSFRQTYYYKAGFDWKLRTGAEAKIKRILETEAFRVEKQDVLNLPPKVKRKISVDLHPVARRIYRHLVEKWCIELEGEKEIETRHIIAKRQKLQQLCSGAVIENGKVIKRVPSAKKERLQTLLQELDGKVIIWCKYTFEVEDVARWCTSQGITAVLLVGSDDALPSVEAFQEVDHVKVFITTYSKGARGLTLTKAKYAVYYGKDNSIERKIQSEDRNHRRGSEIHSAITYYDIYTRDTVEDDMRLTLADKEALNKKILPKSQIRKLLF